MSAGADVEILVLIVGGSMVGMTTALLLGHHGVRVQGRGTDPGYEDFVFDILIDRVEPERSLAWRWHPAVMDPAGDYSSEPMTLVVFELEALNEGTRLRIVESGFDHIPEPRRTQAFHMNNIGWEDVTRNLARYLAQAGG